MAKNNKPGKKKRTGIYVYCSKELKDRIDRARRRAHRTISGYVLHATLQQIERDEGARVPNDKL